jgi:hypothetical protein
VDLAAGDVMELKGTVSEGFYTFDEDVYEMDAETGDTRWLSITRRFVMDNGLTVNASGSVMSLIGGNDMTLPENCFMGLFSGCTGLLTPPELPATELADGCYEMMFYGCSSLSVAPELPAMRLAPSCYYYMFSGCTSLTAAPVLPALMLVWNCYSGMFYGCSSLSYLRCHAAGHDAVVYYGVDVLGLEWDAETGDCYAPYTAGWLEGVAPTGRFVGTECLMTSDYTPYYSDSYGETKYWYSLFPEGCPYDSNYHLPANATGWFPYYVESVSDWTDPVTGEPVIIWSEEEYPIEGVTLQQEI